MVFINFRQLTPHFIAEVVDRFGFLALPKQLLLTRSPNTSLSPITFDLRQFALYLRTEGFDVFIRTGTTLALLDVSIALLLIFQLHFNFARQRIDLYVECVIVRVSSTLLVRIRFQASAKPLV